MRKTSVLIIEHICIKHLISDLWEQERRNDNYAHQSNSSLTQISNQPITWQQLNAFRHVDMIKTICCSSNQHQNGEERWLKWLWTWHGCWCQMGWSETADLLGFSPQPSLGLTENGPKKRKYPVSCSSVGTDALLMVRGEWPDWLELIERQL